MNQVETSAPDIICYRKAKFADDILTLSATLLPRTLVQSPNNRAGSVRIVSFTFRPYEQKVVLLLSLEFEYNLISSHSRRGV